MLEGFIPPVSLSTRLSLIDRLKTGGDSSDWERFYRKYSGAVISFARKQGCDEHAAMDVLQETVMVLMRKLSGFDYDMRRGRFRNWLLTIAAHKSREARRRAHVDRLISLDAPTGDDEPLHEKLGGAESLAPEQLENHWRQAMIEDALRQVLQDPRTNPDTVAIFRAVALEGQSVSEVAARHGIKENAVYQIKNRLMNRLQAIVNDMEGGGLEQLHFDAA